MRNLWAPFTRNLERARADVEFRAITNSPATTEHLDLLTDPEWGGSALELLKMGVPADELGAAIESARVVSSRAHCSPTYAATFVANVRLFTDAPLAPPLLAQWLKPEED